MMILTFFLLLCLVPAIGMIVGTSMMSYFDPSHALRFVAAGGRRRPPGAILMPRASIRRRVPGRYEAHAAARGLALRNGRVPPITSPLPSGGLGGQRLTGGGQAAPGQLDTPPVQGVL